MTDWPRRKKRSLRVIPVVDWTDPEKEGAREEKTQRRRRRNERTKQVSETCFSFSSYHCLRPLSSKVRLTFHRNSKSHIRRDLPSSAHPPLQLTRPHPRPNLQIHLPTKNLPPPISTHSHIRRTHLHLTCPVPTSSSLRRGGGLSLRGESDNEGGLILTPTDEGRTPGAEGVEAGFVGDVRGGGGVEETKDR